MFSHMTGDWSIQKVLEGMEDDPESLINHLTLISRQWKTMRILNQEVQQVLFIATPELRNFTLVPKVYFLMVIQPPHSTTLQLSLLPFETIKPNYFTCGAYINSSFALRLPATCLCRAGSTLELLVGALDGVESEDDLFKLFLARDVFITPFK